MWESNRPERAKEILVKLKYHTPEEAIRSLRQAELEMAGGATAQEVCRRLGINPGTLWRWQKKYGGMEVSEAARIRELEVENDRLKRVVADLEVDRQILREALQKNDEPGIASRGGGSGRDGVEGVATTRMPGDRPVAIDAALPTESPR